MRSLLAGLALVAVSAWALAVSSDAPVFAQDKPRPGGELVYSVLAAPPSFDAHQEATFAVIHTTAPFYSLLVKIDPGNYPKVVPDLAESWTVSQDGRVYTFKLRDGVKFHDESLLTSRDVKASLDHVIFPPQGVISPRKAVYAQVQSVDAPDPRTVQVRLRRPQPGMLTFLASPWNYIYKADLLEKDPNWYKTHIMGTGPFRFSEYVPGSYMTGKKNPDYFVKGEPYLDSFRALIIVDATARVDAFRSGRVAADFVGATPTRDQADLKQALGSHLVIQRSSWACDLLVAINHEKKPFDDPRVRRALSLAIDRYTAAPVINQFSEFGAVAGLDQPGSPFALTKLELAKIPGYGYSTDKNRAEARQLLREAGVPEGFSIVYSNRGITGPERVGVFLIDQWRKIGLNVTQQVLETAQEFAALRSGNYTIASDFSCDFVQEPDLTLVKYISSDKSPINYSRYSDPALDSLYDRQSQERDADKRRQLVWEFERREMGEMAHQPVVLAQVRAVTLWDYVKGWKVTPSHYLNQDLATVWLAK